MEWLEPWCSTEDADDNYRNAFSRQLQLEIAPDHAMFGLTSRLIGRGQGDDALFEILDGTGRVAVVHLTWARTQERPPWPITSFYSSLLEWAELRMQLEHEEWMR